MNCIKPSYLNRLPLRCFALLNILFMAVFSVAYADTNKEVTIGALAKGGEAKARKMWQPTAQYLQAQIPGYRFRLLPLTLDQMNQAVKDDKLDFILTNTGNYVNLEAAYGITRIATLKNMRQGKPYTSFGGVIFVRADRADITNLSELKGKSFAAVSRQAFGGFQMAWRELKRAGIDPFSDFSDLQFMGFPQDDIVKRVRDGKVDAGTVRTDTLKRMAINGEIDLKDYRILNPQTHPGFPFLLSTQLYPEWPFARARNTADEFATRVVIALLSLTPDDPVSKAGLNAGWTVPLSYQGVHDMFKELKIGPYAQTAKVTLMQIISQYRYGLLMIFAAMLFAAYHYVRVERLVTKRTRELSSSNKALEKAIEESRLSEQVTSTYKDHLQLLMNSTAEAIVGINKAGLCTFANLNCVKILGYKSEENLLGKKLEEIISIRQPNTQSVKPTSLSLMTAVQQDESWESDDEFLYCQDGTSFPVEYRVHPIKKDGLTEGYVITFINISRRKIIDAELTSHREHLAELVEARTLELHLSNNELQNNISRLQETQTQLVQAEKMASLGGLVAGFAHEINTPLGIGVTSASNIHEEINTLHNAFESGEMKRSDLQKFIAHCRQGSDILMRNLQRTSELIRSFKQVAIDQSSDDWRPIELHDYVDEIILSIKPKWKHTAVQLVNECDPELNIYSHPGAIYQILSNLILNALIYAFDENQVGQNQINQILIKIKTQEKFVCLDLSDNGKGISNEHQKKIFDPFFTTRRGSGGSGLGLHIVYNLVTATLRGTISCTSNLGEGTVFHIKLPFQTEA